MLDRRPTTAHDVARAVLFRIANGTYAPDNRLPTCEQFAAELGVNKNTVSKAYRVLAGRGYLRTSAGRGTFVLKQPRPADSTSALHDVASQLALVVQEAKLAGVDREQFTTLVSQTVGRYYDRSSVRVGFIECNHLDATVLSRDLQVALAHPVEPLMIGDVTADPERYMHEYDILTVNLSHLVTVEARLREAGRVGGAEIVALLLPPDPESLTQVARLRAGTRLGLVCDLAGTLQSLRGMVAAYNPGVVTRGALTDDEHALREVLRDSDVILVTPSAHAYLVAYQPHMPLISVTFQVDERSIQQLAERLQARIRREVPLAV
jgi:DNA-binding transcriptional regulator YhcF (GntR family)